MDRTKLKWHEMRGKGPYENFRLYYRAELVAELWKWKQSPWTMMVYGVGGAPNKYERFDEVETVEEAKALAEALVIFDN